MKDNLIIYVSSHNNYDMLEGEVFKNINTEGFEFINVDDKSCDGEISKGKAMCKKHGVVFLENKSRGVQMATQTLVDFINKERPNCKWIFCFQHDNYPISKDFFSTISNYIKEDKLEDFGVLGFNVLDYGFYTLDSLQKFNNGEKPLGILGLGHLSIKDGIRRWICPMMKGELLKNEKWNNPSIVDFPMWAAVGLNIKRWNDCIIPTTDYQFHLWLPDIAMQFNYNNFPCLTIPSLYCMNNQQLKAKYNINPNSAQGAREGNEYHFGKYSNFEAWIKRWGWHYEDVVGNFENVKENYRGTLIWDFYHHDLNKGPLKNYDLD